MGCFGPGCLTFFVEGLFGNILMDTSFLRETEEFVGSTSSFRPQLPNTIVSISPDIFFSPLNKITKLKTLRLASTVHFNQLLSIKTQDPESCISSLHFSIVWNKDAPY